MLRAVQGLALVIALSAGMAGCGGDDGAQVVSLEKKHEIRTPAVPRAAVLRVAVGGMVTSTEGLAYYRQLLDYVAEKLGMDVYLVVRDSYFEVNRLVKIGAADAAFVSGGPYVDGHDAFGMELLVAPRTRDGQGCYSYIIVRKDSAISSLKELRGKRFAFTDPMSNTGRLVPLFLLAKMHEDPETFFIKTIFTRSHDRSIKAVAQGIVDGAAVDSLVWEYENRVNPGFTAQTKIIMRSSSGGAPPVVVRRGLDPWIKEQLRRILLTAHQDEQGRSILQGMMIDRFGPIQDSAYDPVRVMKAALAGRGKGGGG